jgi:hypothetical protein
MASTDTVVGDLPPAYVGANYRPAVVGSLPWTRAGPYGRALAPYVLRGDAYGRMLAPYGTTLAS